MDSLNNGTVSKRDEGIREEDEEMMVSESTIKVVSQLIPAIIALIIVIQLTPKILDGMGDNATTILKVDFLEPMPKMESEQDCVSRYVSLKYDEPSAKDLCSRMPRTIKSAEENIGVEKDLSIRIFGLRPGTLIIASIMVIIGVAIGWRINWMENIR